MRKGIAYAWGERMREKKVYYKLGMEMGLTNTRVALHTRYVQ